jgi:hypothetical protein
MAQRALIHLGIGGNVVALDARSGDEVWRTPLKGADFVNVAAVGGILCAAAKGQVFALDPGTGRILWHNQLKGLGLGFVTFAQAGQAASAAAHQKQQHAAASD